MPSLVEHQIHQNIIYISNRRVKSFLQCGVATINDVLHAQQGHQKVAKVTKMLVILRTRWNLFIANI